jgi:hypothetical protein
LQALVGAARVRVKSLAPLLFLDGIGGRDVPA